MKKIAIVWSICLVLIFSALTVFGFMYISRNQDYKAMEKALVEAAKRIDVTTYHIDSYKIFSFEELKEANVIDEDALTLNNEECEGYARITRNNYVFEYKGFVKCENYTTRGY